MKEFVFVLLSFLIPVYYCNAQVDNVILLKNVQNNKSHILKQGDFVMVKMIDAGLGKRHFNGKIQGIQAGNLLLAGHPNLPLDHIQQIKYRPKYPVWLQIGLIFLGLALFVVSFLVLLKGVFPEKGGEDIRFPLAFPLLFLLGGVALFLPIKARTINHLNGSKPNWTYEVIQNSGSKPAPLPKA